MYQSVFCFLTKISKLVHPFFSFSIKLMQNSTLEWVNCVNDIMRKNGSAANPQLIKLAGGSVSLSSA